MARGSAPTLFISSTCYDLAQLRADLRDFAEEAGFEPVLSELDSFPVDPSHSTLKNCIEAVRKRADIFVLVVGGRYGSINEAGKSITNLEYLEASAKRIPKYVFVKSEIISVLPIWRSNPEADFSSTVDTPKLFEFVSQLRDKGEVWVFPFNTAQDITRTLRKQLSYLFSDCLAIRSKLQDIDLPALGLGPGALKIYVEKPSGWEYLAFAKILQDRVFVHQSKRLDLELGISFGPVTSLPNLPSAVEWVLGKITQIIQIVENLSNALNAGIKKAVGEPGEPGDIYRIEHVASRIADGYAEAIEWTLEFHRLSIDSNLERLMQIARNISANMLSEIEVFSAELFGKIQYAIENHNPGDSVRFTLTLTTPDVTDFSEELAKIQQSLLDL
jgi:hypothetical protein